jgi:fatty-acyl-CoA synthase
VEETAHVVEASGVGRVYVSSVYRDRILAVTAALDGVQVESLGGGSQAGMLGLPQFPLTTPAQADPALVIYTSGTTGRPKGVIYTHGMLDAIALQWSLMEPIPSTDLRALFVLPLAGIGIPWTLLQILTRGGTLVLQQRFDAVAAVDLLASHRITWFTGVPTIFAEMAKTDGFAAADLTSLERAIVGGAAVSPALLASWRARGVELRQLYGLTEAGGGFMASALDDADPVPDRCGHGGVLTELRVVRSDGTECLPGEIGAIEVRGPSCTPGYWRDPVATAELIVDGWLRTGDLGEVDSLGRLRFVSRAKDLIITGGFNVAPAEIEEVLAGFTEVIEVAVVPAADDKFGEVPAAIIRLRASLELDEIARRCRVVLADYKVPKRVVIVDCALPRTRFGKVAKDVLRAEHALSLGFAPTPTEVL